MRTALRIGAVLCLLATLVACAGRQYGPAAPTDLTIARSLDALAHAANALAMETVILAEQGKLTKEELQAIVAWCRQTDAAIPRAFEVLKASTPQDRAAAVSTVLAEVARTGPLRDLIAQRGAEVEMQAAITLAQTVLVLVREFVPEASDGR